MIFFCFVWNVENGKKVHQRLVTAVAVAAMKMKYMMHKTVECDNKIAIWIHRSYINTIWRNCAVTDSELPIPIKIVSMFSNWNICPVYDISTRTKHLMVLLSLDFYCIFRSFRLLFFYYCCCNCFYILLRASASFNRFISSAPRQNRFDASAW